MNVATSIYAVAVLVVRTMSDINRRTKLKTFNKRVTIREAEDVGGAILDSTKIQYATRPKFLMLGLAYLALNLYPTQVLATADFGLITKNAAKFN